VQDRGFIQPVEDDQMPPAVTQVESNPALSRGRTVGPERYQKSMSGEDAQDERVARLLQILLGRVSHGRTSCF
jgi:hypothetical protein